MRGNAADFKKFLPTIFANLGIKFSTETGEPLLVIKIEKKDDVVVVTTSPELNTKDMAEKLNPFAFDDEKIYELQFGRDGLKTCLVDGVTVAATKNPGLRDFLTYFFHNSCTATSDLDKALGCLPSVEELTKAIEREVEQRLTSALVKGDQDNFVTGPTNIVPICPHKAATIDPSIVDILHMIGLDKVVDERQPELEAMARDKTTLVTIVPVECNNVFFNLIATILVAAIETMLPGIVRTKQNEIMDRAEAAFVVLRDARCAATDEIGDMPQA